MACMPPAAECERFKQVARFAWQEYPSRSRVMQAEEMKERYGDDYCEFSECEDETVG